MTYSEIIFGVIFLIRVDENKIILSVYAGQEKKLIMIFLWVWLDLVNHSLDAEKRSSRFPRATAYQPPKKAFTSEISMTVEACVCKDNVPSSLVQVRVYDRSKRNVRTFKT